MNYSKKHLKHRFYRVNFAYPALYESYSEYIRIHTDFVQSEKYYKNSKAKNRRRK